MKHHFYSHNNGQPRHLAFECGESAKWFKVEDGDVEVTVFLEPADVVRLHKDLSDVLAQIEAASAGEVPCAAA